MQNKCLVFCFMIHYAIPMRLATNDSKFKTIHKLYIFVYLNSKGIRIKNTLNPLASTSNKIRSLFQQEDKFVNYLKKV